MACPHTVLLRMPEFMTSHTMGENAKWAWLGLSRPRAAFPFLGRGPERTGSVFFRNKSLIKRHPGNIQGLCLWFCTPNKRPTKGALNNSLFLRRTCEASWHFRCRCHASFIKVPSVCFATAFSTQRSEWEQITMEDGLLEWIMFYIFIYIDISKTV